MIARSDSTMLERLLAPVSESLNAEAARKLVRLKADRATQARVDALAEKANEGQLTAAERSEYERLVAAGNLIAILQAQARLILAQGE
jgi:hypothetical protein